MNPRRITRDEDLDTAGEALADARRSRRHVFIATSELRFKALADERKAVTLYDVFEQAPA